MTNRELADAAWAELQKAKGLLDQITDPAAPPTPPPPTTPPPTTPPPATGAEGRVGFCMYATAQADKYDLSPGPTATQKAWINAHWNRAIIYMDQIAGWLNGDWGYLDVLATYTSSSTVTQHPDWLLHDVAGNKLTFFSSVQYLSDIGNPAYQDSVAQRIGTMASRGYRGVHCDDVNLDRVVRAEAVNPRTGQRYTLQEWQRDFATMMEKIRKAAPKPFEIVHNALWWASGPDVDRQIKACDVYELERGFCDPKYTPAKIAQLWNWVDRTHSLGAGVNHLAEGATTKQQAMFNLGCALMCSNGHDYQYASYGWQPDGWWPGHEVDLGAAKGPRVDGGTVFRRSFDKGTVTVDLAARTASIPGVA
jgi:Hypothetical glycosyl hydrolase family 15